MLRVWLSWLGGVVIIVALVLIALAARDLVLAADAGRAECAHGDRFRNASAAPAPWHAATSPVLDVFDGQPAGSGSV